MAKEVIDEPRPAMGIRLPHRLKGPMTDGDALGNGTVRRAAFRTPPSEGAIRAIIVEPLQRSVQGCRSRVVRPLLKPESAQFSL